VTRLSLAPTAVLAAGTFALAVLAGPVGAGPVGAGPLAAGPVAAGPVAAGAGLAGAGEAASDVSGGLLVGGSCDAVSGAHPLPGSNGVTPAAWSGGGLTVPACGPIPGDDGSAGDGGPARDGGPDSLVSPYPGSLWTSGYQCVEFSERYLYYRFGVTMDIPTDGDQVAAHYAARYPGLFTVVPNGTPHRAPVTGDVLSMSDEPGFGSRSGGHTAVVQASSVNAVGDGAVTIVEENAAASGVEVLRVRNWHVTYRGYRYVEWLTTIGLVVTTPWLPTAEETRPYAATLTATGGAGAYRWTLTRGTLPPGLTLSATGVLAGTPAAETPDAGEPGGVGAVTGTGTSDWPVTVSVSDSRGAIAVAVLNLVVAVPPAEYYYCQLLTVGASCAWAGALA